jgi:ribonuclease D
MEDEQLKKPEESTEESTEETVTEPVETPVLEELTEVTEETAKEEPVAPQIAFDEEGRQIATDEEKLELKSLEFKRTQMPIGGDDVARIEYLNTLRHD